MSRTPGLTEFYVTWSISLDASNPLEAARLALENLRDPASTALAFEVDGDPVDLQDPPVCAAQTRGATRIDQAEFCENEPTRRDDNGDWYCDDHEAEPPEPDWHPFTEEADL